MRYSAFSIAAVYDRREFLVSTPRAVIDRPYSAGFSLLEVMIALAISLSIGAIVFQIFHQNERVFRDQNLIVEAQQAARTVTSQLADEVRMAGQGVPIYASTFDASATEPVAVILAGSNSERINFRAGLSNIATSITDPMPLEVEIGMSQTVTVAKASLFSRSLGTSSPVGRFIYVWGPAANDSWSWLRAELTGISAANGTLTIVPRQAGEAGRSGNVITITNPPAAALEEAVAFFLDSGSVRRATAKDTTDQTNPTWSTASEIGRNVTSLELTYYDENNNVVAPDTLAARISIVSIGITLGTQTSERLGTGERAAFTLSTRTVLRNAKIR